MRSMTSSKRERGSVLIMALLVVALVAAFAIKASRDYQLSLARAEGRWHGTQAQAYLAGAERLAIFFLEQDDTSIDSLLEDWAQPIPPFPIEGGMLMAEIVDASARLNLNDLSSAFAEDKAVTDPARYNENQRRFIRLLQSFEAYPLPLEDATGILEALVDWVDPDPQPSGFNGAERDYYQSLDPPYLPANRPFSSVEELRLVRGMTPRLMHLLRPYLSALPAGEVPLNVNTLPDQLLRCFNNEAVLQPLNPEQIGLLRQEVLEYATIDDFKNNGVWSSIIAEENGVNADATATTTSYFQVTAIVALGEQRRARQSLLKRTNQGETAEFSVVSRRDVYDFTPTIQNSSDEGY